MKFWFFLGFFFTFLFGIIYTIRLKRSIYSETDLTETENFNIEKSKIKGRFRVFNMRLPRHQKFNDHLVMVNCRSSIGGVLRDKGRRNGQNGKNIPYHLCFQATHQVKA
ncbi:uncharacterized protein LOC116847185 isoform X1 [Odontomachus brunneus]|uniref:uncharacterized protein LOC116847185 isoform X1 n=1 Tax=Odontomachus brunneus TaxID=486640 RepID=UPI0013F21A78|nr:uncharacterized protein LOC116847185 isoform X1 [Odontomachus brunneus]